MRSKSVISVLSLALSAAFLAVTLADIGIAQVPEAPKAKAKGTPKAKAPVVDTLGEGPWDLATETGTVHVSVVTKGLDHPWAIVWLPDGDMLITERAGRLRVLRKGVLDPAPIAGLPEIRAGILGGLMDIALHPQFAQNRLVYFSYSKGGEADNPARATLAVGSARWDGGSTLTDVKDVFVTDGYHGGKGAPKGCCGQGPSDASYGSRILFDKDGMLYVTSGDRNYGERSQDLMSHIGKILRLRDDGTVPQDNPFVGKPWVKPEIYSYGHRNPLGLTIHPVTGELWSSEFGPNGGDEVNKIVAGKNYGWISATKGKHYSGQQGGESEPGWIDPVIYFVPSINPGNLAFYNGDKFPAWKGNLLMGTMTRTVFRAAFDAQGKAVAQERMFADLKQRFRDTRVGPDGFVYLLTDETFGALLKLEPGR